ncbi:CYTH domain-containing protein [Emcibacter sp. SYSU 3D8]|uniref:CYTH domain-containing protein n=1 Tax=Emcibacter sp. SYSU 3D8 TaxID=3133969 RepID=UPI0031FE68FB
MQIEIERKFLLRNDGWKNHVIDSRVFTDGLIASDAGGKVRVRLGEAKATITVKSPRTGLRRTEFEYEIPRAHAEAMFAACCDHRIIEKTRYYVREGETIWDIDVYGGDLAGIALAEIELQDESQPFTIPDWLGQEVTGDRRFSKRNIVRLYLETGNCPSMADLLALPDA